VRDSESFLSRTLALQQPQALSSAQDGSNVGGALVVGRAAHGTSGSTNEVSALHSKFTQDPNFKGVRGQFGADKLFAAGISAIVGPMDVQYIRAIYNEHCLVPGAQESFTAFQGLGCPIQTNPEREWLFVVGSACLDRVTWTFEITAQPKVEKEMTMVWQALGMMVEGRNAKTLAVLMQSPKVKRAGMSAAEVVALRLYTGPMYMKYNAVLRCMAGATAGGTSYSATIHLISSGLRKLSRVSEPPAGMVLYRGNGGMALPSGFLEPDEQGFAGGTELGIMSASPNRSVALGFSGLYDGKVLPTLFEIEVTKTSFGADISWLSQFEEEQEYCYAPLTHLQLVGEARLEQHNGQQLSILRIRLTVNQRSMTVEQAERARKDFLTQLASSLECDVRHWAKRQELLERLAPKIADMRAALQAVVAETEASKLNDNTKFGSVFGRVIEVSEEKRRQLAEAVWQDGEAARGRGKADAAAALFEKAIDARGRGLCADDKEGRDRIVAMRRVVMEASGGGGDKEKQAAAKFHLANLFQEQGKLSYDEAIALYQEAIELFTEVRFQYALSMCVGLHRGLIFAGCAFCYPWLPFCFYYRWATKTPLPRAMQTLASCTRHKERTRRRFKVKRNHSKS
jgi:tetratricopeptide (TPR) repeat protein